MFDNGIFLSQCCLTWPSVPRKNTGSLTNAEADMKAAITKKAIMVLFVIIVETFSAIFLQLNNYVRREN